MSPSRETTLNTRTGPNPSRWTTVPPAAIATSATARYPWRSRSTLRLTFSCVRKVPVLLQVLGREGLQQRSLLGVQGASVDEKVGQRPRPVECPGLEGGDQDPLVDQADLQGKQAQEEVSLDCGHGVAPFIGGRSGAGPSARA